jgi:D-amino-acid dehydrogenase
MTAPVAGRNRAPTLGGIDEENLIAWARYGDRVRVTATAEFAGHATSWTEADFRHMDRTVRDLFPDGADWDQAERWAGLRPMTPSGLPIYGRGRLRNLWLDTGQGHMGWTMGAGSARIVADLIAGRTPGIDTSGMMVGETRRAA